MIEFVDNIFKAIEQAIQWWLNTELPEQTFRALERILNYDAYEILTLIREYINTIFS